MATDPTTLDVTTDPATAPVKSKALATMVEGDETPTMKVAMSPLESMAADKSVAPELMTGTQKELSSIQGLSAGIRAAQTRAQKVLDGVLDNEAQGIQSRGEGAINPQLDVNKLSEVYQPEQVQIILDRRKAYSNRFNATADWDANTPHSKLMADVEKLNPRNVPANSPAFETHVEMYKDAQKRALGIEKERERVLKQTQEETGAQMNQMMLPDALRPDGVPKITDAWLKANASKLKDEDIQKAAKFLVGGADYSDRGVREDAINRAIWMEPGDFRDWAMNAHNAKLLSNPDLDHVLTMSKEAQDDAGVKYIKEAMNTTLLGKDGMMESILSGLRQKVVQQYLAERSAHPEWKDPDRLGAAMRIERDNQIFNMERIQQNLLITPTMKATGATSRPAMTPEILAQAKLKTKADIEAGRLNAYQKTVEMNAVKAWEEYFAYLAANTAAKKAGQEGLKQK